MSSMYFVNEHLNISSSMPIEAMTSFMRKASKSGLPNVEDLVKMGTPIIFDKSLKITDAQYSSAKKPMFTHSGYSSTFIQSVSGALRVETDKGFLYIQSNNMKDIKASTLGIVPNFDQEVSILSVPASLVKWIQDGSRGLSSDFMANTLFGLPSKGESDYWDPSEYNYPHDPDDLSRCLAFLEQVPEAKERLHELSETGSEWAGLIDHWDDLVTMFNNKDDGLYKAMKSAQSESMRPS